MALEWRSLEGPNQKPALHILYDILFSPISSDVLSRQVFFSKRVATPSRESSGPTHKNDTSDKTSLWSLLEIQETGLNVNKKKPAQDMDCFH